MNWGKSRHAASGVRPMPDRRVVPRMFIRSRNRPEPFKTYDRYESRRGKLWVFAGVGVIAAVALVALMSDNAPRRPRAPNPPPVAPVAEVVVPRVPAPATPAPALAAQPVAPVAARPPSPVPPAPEAVATVPEPQPASAPEPAVREVVTTGRSGSNLRSAPSMSGAVLWTAPRGTRLRVAGEEGSWLQVATPDGDRAGWMHRSVVEE